MKITKLTRKRLHDVKWTLLGLAWIVLAIIIYPPALAITLISIALLLVVFMKRIAWWKISWQENRLINAQPNAHQRGYILQRLKALPYVNDTYSTRDPNEEKTFTVRHYLNEHLIVVYLIDFVENEYVGPADIGNEYRRTNRSYQLSPKWSKIHYGESVAFHYSGQVEYHKREVKRQELDHLPDDVIEYIEHALINWEPISHGK